MVAIPDDATLLAVIRAPGIGGEQFASGNHPNPFWGVLNRVREESIVGDRVVDNWRTELEMRSSDVALHRLVKGSVVTRLGDAATFVVKRFADDGAGMHVLVLGA